MAITFKQDSNKFEWQIRRRSTCLVGTCWAALCAKPINPHLPAEANRNYSARMHISRNVIVGIGSTGGVSVL